MSMNIEQIKHFAKELIEPQSIKVSDPTEYIRGICELIGEIDARHEISLGDRAKAIAEELGIPIEIINTMW